MFAGIMLIEENASAMKIQYSLPNELKAKVDAAIADWQSNQKVTKLWQKDASLWSGDDEGWWLGWLDIVERQQKEMDAYKSLSAEIQKGDFESALLLGMGGSSLCPEVLTMTFGRTPGFPELHIVDSTDPAQVKAAADHVNLKKTIIVVSSKSGSTLEPNILKQYFYDEMKKAVGEENAGRHFIAVTDPGSKMEKVARADGFRHIFYGDPQIGGRYSALSNFGLIPAAVIGLDVEKLLRFARKGMDACKQTSIVENPGALIGILMGQAAKVGRDKITFFASPEIRDLGAWFEQLIAESTGKVGKGITPVDREAIAEPQVYGNDRLFVHLKLDRSVDEESDNQVAALEKAGHPVIQIGVSELYAIATQFFIWEIATAVAGSILEINPFNQPDVEASKVETRRLTTEYEQTGKLTETAPVLECEGVKLFADDKYASVLKKAASGATLVEYLRAHLNQLHPGDYFAALAYLTMTPENERILQQFRHKVRDARKIATCLGFGPRFLHSTGQDYKGGPNTGVFLQITSDHARDLAIPGQKYTFGIVLAAQAAGDLAVLQQRGRRALRVHLPADVDTGLKTLAAAVEKALS
jgi:glucose-6-phosphate isomerase